MVDTSTPANSLPIYHLTPARYYDRQPIDQPYQAESFAQEGFIHCSSGTEVLIQVANRYFSTSSERLLALKIDPTRLDAPLKFEAPVPPPTPQLAQHTPDYTAGTLFPHIYGPINREAIVAQVELQRDEAGQWSFPKT